MVELKPRNDLRIVESALFISPEPLRLKDLRRVLGISSKKYIISLIKKLKDEYEKRGSSIEIVSAEDRFGMRVKDEYLDFVKDLNRETEITRSALKVLAYVSKNEGILKSKLVKRIGTHVYVAVKELVDKGFITQKRFGRSSKLFTTRKFREYFKIDVGTKHNEK